MFEKKCIVFIHNTFVNQGLILKLSKKEVLLF